MPSKNSFKDNEPRFGKTLRDDFHQVKIKEEFKSEYKDLKEYFLTDERKERLKSMSGFKKFFVIPFWMFKSLYFKLTPFRRILLIAGLILLFLSVQVQTDSNQSSSNDQLFTFVSGLVFLFIIALELKDKLFAKTELEEGRAVQNALMPEQHPTVKGWDVWLYTNPANDVGGDLLDFLAITESKIGITVGDVAGKGLSAALLMAKLQSTIRAIVPDYGSLEELGRKLNRIFCRDSLPRLFASLCYAELDTESGQIKILNAGHLPPIMIKNSVTQKLKSTSPALGIIPDADFKSEKTDLQSGDYMIIHSDGLTEARNEEGEFYGEKRLKICLNNLSDLSAQAVGNLILTDVNEFISKAKVYDDLTIAVIKKI